MRRCYLIKFTHKLWLNIWMVVHIIYSIINYNFKEKNNDISTPHNYSITLKLFLATLHMDFWDIFYTLKILFGILEYSCKMLILSIGLELYVLLWFSAVLFDVYSLTIFIEREIARNISTESIIDRFCDLKDSYNNTEL